ncbi:MAG TPA: UvrD-helicase domain-containing protein [Verrucomicrobiae bacterium]|nr:UvrD-helicase domain-containing protein [Verrucomicrobiae bacterium]
MATTGIDYPKELNPDQLAAATAPPGPALVLAGAGSGKTRTLTYRVAFLVENGLPPENILLLTFTNKAAREMLERVRNLLPHDISRLWGGTFHSVGNRILRRHAPAVGLEPGFTILDRDDARDLLAACFPAIGVDPKEKRFPKAGAILELLSFSANTTRPLDELLATGYAHLEEFADALSRLADEYRKRKLASNAADYDDLLTLPLDLLRRDPRLARHYQDRWACVLVDEYQDTNRVQADFIDLVASAHRNVTVVGDDAQSIYSWRGANFENILSFPDRYPGSRVYRIELNYRSVPQILSLANASIANNSRQFPKALRSTLAAGVRPHLVATPDADGQARFIAREILSLHSDGTPLREIAVLYRAHAHAIELQMELVRCHIPFVITSGIQFFEQAHVKDVAAYLKTAFNPFDEIAFKRVARLMPGVGDRSAEKLWQRVRGQSEWPEDIAPAKAVKDWRQLRQLIAQLRAQPGPSVPDAISWILDACYRDMLNLKYDNHQQRIDDIQQLQEFSRRFDSVPDLLAQLSLMTGLDASYGGADDGDVLRLSTVHQAKGLEWEAAFVIMLCDGAFPLGRLIDDEAQLEEERRLFYVAVTRAKKRLYLTFPQMRFGRGAAGGDLFQRPSRFLTELPPGLAEPVQIRIPRETAHRGHRHRDAEFDPWDWS